MFTNSCKMYSQRALRCTSVLYRQHPRNWNRSGDKILSHCNHYHDHNEQKTLTAQHNNNKLSKQSDTRLQRAPLLMQLADKETTTDITECHSLEQTTKTEEVDKSNDDVWSSKSNKSENAFLQPSHFASKFRHCANQGHSRLALLPSTSSSSSLSSSLSTPSAVQELNEIEASLRESTNYAAAHNTITLRKDSKLYRQACQEFYKTHHRWPSIREVSPNVNVSVSSVSVLKALEHCDPSTSDDCKNDHKNRNKYNRCANSIYKAARESLKLQQAITRNQLAQSNDRVLMRCERCFHVYAARPRTLYRDELNHSWAVFEHEVEMQKRVKQLTIKPQSRKVVYSVGRQQRRVQDSPTCCPHCKSTTHQQWMFEYVHQRTHCHLTPSSHEKKRLR